MAKWSPFNTVFRWNFLPIFVGVIFITFGVAVGGWYTIGLQWTINSFEAWFVVGWSILMLGVGATGFDAMLKEATTPAVTPIGVFPLADIVPLQVSTHVYTPRTESGDAPKVDGKEYRPEKVGLDSNGRRTPLEVIPLGGRKGYGLHISPGRLGYLVAHGSEDYIRMSDRRRGGEFLFTPKVLISLDHTHVEPEVIDTLVEHQKFVKGKSAFYGLGGVSPTFAEWVVRHWDFLEEIKKGTAVITDPNEGRPDNIYYQGRYHSELAENQNLRYRERSHLDTIARLTDIINGNARSRAKAVASRRQPGEEEVYRRGIPHPLEENI